MVHLIVHRVRSLNGGKPEGNSAACNGQARFIGWLGLPDSWESSSRHTIPPSIPVRVTLQINRGGQGRKCCVPLPSTDSGSARLALEDVAQSISLQSYPTQVQPFTLKEHLPALAAALA